MTNIATDLTVAEIPAPAARPAEKSFFAKIWGLFTPVCVQRKGGPKPVRHVQVVVDPPPKLNSNNLLTRIHGVTFQALASKPYPQRKATRRELAKEVLDRGKPGASKVDWRQFALLHCPMTRETSLEGGQEKASVGAARYFIQRCLAQEGLFFSVDVPEKVFKRIESALETYNDFLENRFPYSNVPLDKGVLEERATHFLEQIQKTLHSLPDQEKVVYLPLGYRHGGSNQGHVIVCKLEESDKDIILTLFNLGNGSSSHPILNYSLNQKKVSFCFFPIPISKEIFFGAVGRAALCHLLRYLTDAPSPGQAYDGNDIYDIFLQLAVMSGIERIPSNLGPHTSEYAANPQIFGNCPEIAVKCVLEDSLISQGVPSDARLKIELNRSFNSLIAAYQAFIANPDGHPSARTLLHDAAQSFGAEILGLHGNKAIAEQELIAAQAVVYEIVKVTRKTPHRLEEPSKMAVSVAEPSAIDVSREFPQPHALQEKAVSKSDVVVVQVEAPMLDECAFDPSIFKIEEIGQFPAVLKKWVAIASKLPPRQAFVFVTDCIRTLPIPIRQKIVEMEKIGDDEEVEITGDVRALDPWDTLPPELIKETVAGLEVLMQIGLKDVEVAKNTSYSITSPSESFTDQFMTIYAAYAIVDALTRREKEANLEGFASPFLPPPFTFEPNGFISLPLKEDNERFSQIHAYFTGQDLLTDKGTQNPVIFPMGPQLHVQKFVSDHLSHHYAKERIQGRNHIRYLTKLLPGSIGDLSEKDLTQLFCKEWWTVLPPNVRSLYYFVLLSHALFSASGRRFPKALVFSETSIAGQPGLKVEDPYFLETPMILRSLVVFEAQDTPKLEQPLYDKRFFQNATPSIPYVVGCGGYARTSFINIFSPQVRNLKTNDAICYMLSEDEWRNWQISEPDLRMLLYITRKPNLSFWQALHEFSTSRNDGLLKHAGVQHILDVCFFHPRFLLERLKHEPLPVVQRFRKFISEGLQRLDNNLFRSSGFLFILREGICFESYTEPSPEREKAFALYRKAIEALLKQPNTTALHIEVILHSILLEMQCEQKDPSRLFAFLFHAAVFSDQAETPWLLSNAPKFLRTAAYRYAPLLADQATRDAICNQIITYNFRRRNLPKPGPSGPWTGTFPQFSCGDYRLDFFNGTIGNTRHRGLLKKGTRTDRVSENHYHKHGWFFWIDKNHEEVSLDGTLRYNPETGDWSEIASADSGVQKSPVIEDLAIFNFDTQESMDSYETLPWVHHQEQDGVITTWDQKKKCPYLRIERKPGSVVYIRLDPSGGRLPYTLANLKTLDPAHPLCHYTTRFTSPDQLLCFTNEKTGVIEELNFYHAQIQFVRDPRGLASEQFRGFYLIAVPEDLAFEDQQVRGILHESVESLSKMAEDGTDPVAQRALQCRALVENHAQVVEEINFKSALILYNPDTKKWRVLLPDSLLQNHREDFSRDVSPKKKIISYIHLEFDPRERALRGEHKKRDQANLKLALLFKMQRDYERAYKYLNYLNTSRDLTGTFSDEIFHFRSLRDHSMASVAFNLKLFLLLIKNGNLMFEKRFSYNPSNSISRDLGLWGMENYKTYIELTNERGVNKIPEVLRLSEGEKKMLLIAFRKAYRETHYHEWEERWRKEQPVLDIQYHVFFSWQRENTVHPPVQEIPLHPPIFSAIIPPEWIRIVSFDGIIAFYKKAHDKTPKKGVDLLLEMSEYPNDVSDVSLAAHFPELYERARRCTPGIPDPFDFTLHALIKTSPSQHSTFYNGKLGHLLFWVRHFSDAFSHPSFSLEKVTPQNIEKFRPVMEKIVQRVVELKQAFPERYAAFERTVLKGKMKFELGREIRISAPREQFPKVAYVPSKKGEIPQNPQAYLEETEAQIHALFNTPYKLKGDQLLPADMEAETEYLLQKASAQTLSIPKRGKKPSAKSKLETFGLLPETLMKQVILKNSMNFLFKHRPMLRPEQMQELCWLVNEWYHTQVLLKLEQEGNSHLYIPYDHQKYPEISFFYLKTGKFPRIGQLTTYQWISEGVEQGRNRHFQLPAGEGKTDVVIPLLNLGSKRWGLMPVTCVTQAIYPVDKENLGFNLGILDEGLCYLEVGMHMINTLTDQNLEFIFSQLKQYKSEGKSLIITPQTFYALFLVFHLACIRAGEEHPMEPNGAKIERGGKIRWSLNILNFFKKECVFLCDESHSNLDALTRAVYGLGDFVPLLPHESSHLLQLMKPLLKAYPESRVECIDGRDASEVAHLTENLEATPNDGEVAMLQMHLARSYIALFPEITKEQRSAFVMYWINEDSPQPDLLKQWAMSDHKADRQRASKVALTGNFLLQILPDILRLRTEIDHGRSLYPQKKHEIPCHNKMPSTAEYDDRYKTCALTIKGAFGRGITDQDIRGMLSDMVKSSSDEQRKGYPIGNTPSNQRLKKWVKGTSSQNLRVEDINFGQTDPLYDLLRKNCHAVEYFLTEYSFKGIGSSSQQISCTTSDLLNWFLVSISFSATPREDLAHPRCLRTEDYLKDPQFQVQVREKLREPKNSRVIFVDTAANFFASVKEQHPEIFASATVMIDPRGFFSGRRNLDLAKEWMENNPSLDGVLYWSEARSISIDRHEKVCLLRKNGKVDELDGSNIVAALKILDLDWETLHLGTIFDPTRSESANILQKPDAVAFFFPWEGLTFSHAAQALMRLRGFINKNQTIIWVFQRNLAKKIFVASGVAPSILPSTSSAVLHNRKPEISVDAEELALAALESPSLDLVSVSPAAVEVVQATLLELDSNAFLDWTDKNEKEQEEKRIILNAFQEIAYAIAKAAYRHIEAAHANDPSETLDLVIAAHKKYANGLLETLPRDAYEAFGEHDTLNDTRDVLEKYARGVFVRFGYDYSYEEDGEMAQVIEEIISAVEKRIENIYANTHQNVAKEVEQQIQLRTETQRQQENQCPRPVEPLSIDGVYGNVQVYSPAYLNTEKTSVRKLFNSPFFTTDLYFRQNQLRTAKISDSGNPELQFIKPIHFMIIVLIEQGSGWNVQALVDSNEIIGTDQDNLVKCPKAVKNLKHRAFLVTADGELIQKGTGALTPPNQLVEEILGSTWMTDLEIDAALLRGHIVHPERLLARIQKAGWDSFEKLWNKILKALPNAEQAQFQDFEDLKNSFLATQ